MTTGQWIDYGKIASPIIAAIVLALIGVCLHAFLARKKFIRGVLYEKRIKHYETLLDYWWTPLTELIITNYTRQYNQVHGYNQINQEVTEDVLKERKERHVVFLKMLLVTKDKALKKMLRAQLEFFKEALGINETKAKKVAKALFDILFQVDDDDPDPEKVKRLVKMIGRTMQQWRKEVRIGKLNPFGILYGL